LFFALTHCNTFVNSEKVLNCPSIKPQNHFPYAKSPTRRGEDPKFDWKLDGTIQIPHGSIPVHIDDDISYFQGSVEYTWKAWTFQTEYYTYLLHPVDGDGSRADAWYAAASYRINKWVEAGVYYSEYYGDTTQRANSLDYQKDAALALRFDLRDWWILKVEGHYIHGTGLLEDDGANPSQDNRGWFMLALKTTVSF